jgi:ubiquinone/menaquinone biosynthesis C-methylase UbiE
MGDEGKRLEGGRSVRRLLRRVEVVATIDYSGRMASVYDAGRSLPASAVETWMNAAARHIQPRSRPILDLGSGTGRFSGALAERFGVSVVALEPAAGMQAQASRRNDTGVLLVAGDATMVPTASGVFSAVWASQVVHHVADRARLAVELARVLIPGGCVLVRGMLTGRPEAIAWAPWFPAAAAATRDQFPQLAEIASVFAAAGLEHTGLEAVRQVSACDLNDFVT